MHKQRPNGPFCILFLVLPSENRITREHDTAMNKLFDWQARFEMQLNETLQSVKEFHTKDRMSEAKTYLAQLEELKEKVQVFLEEVGRLASTNIITSLSSSLD